MNTKRALVAVSSVALLFAGGLAGPTFAEDANPVDLTVATSLASNSDEMASSVLTEDGDFSDLTASEFLAGNPGGRLVGDGEVVYPDGSGFVAAAGSGLISVGGGGGNVLYSTSQCGSSQFCMWSNENYAGSYVYVTGSGVTKALTGKVKSFWNNRAHAARLYNNSGTASTCYAAGAKKAAVDVGYQTASKVYLSSGTTC